MYSLKYGVGVTVWFTVLNSGWWRICIVSLNYIHWPE